MARLTRTPISSIGYATIAVSIGACAYYLQQEIQASNPITSSIGGSGRHVLQQGDRVGHFACGIAEGLHCRRTRILTQVVLRQSQGYIDQLEIEAKELGSHGRRGRKNIGSRRLLLGLHFQGGLTTLSTPGSRRRLGFLRFSWLLEESDLLIKDWL